MLDTIEQTHCQRMLARDIAEARKAARDPRSDALIRKTWKARLEEIESQDAVEHAARELHKVYTTALGGQATCNLYEVGSMVEVLGIRTLDIDEFLGELRRAGYIDLYRTAPPYQFVNLMRERF